MPTDVTSSTTPRGGRWHRWTPVLAVAVAVLLAPLAGLGATAATAPDDDTLRLGAEVYTAACAACHQSGGVGLAGRYPPLVDNPNLADPAYIEDVIRNGLSGEVVVNGVTYNGVMPAQSTLSDADTAAVIAYIMSGFAAPSGPIPEVNTGPAAGTELPLLASYAWIAAFAIVIGLGVLVLGPRVVAAHDRREIPWVDAWLKTAVIVVGAVVVTTIVPAKVLEVSTVQRLPRATQDLITLALWASGVGVTLLALWYAHRERRV
jgi:mono/diheme cytochrome c family protein